MLWNTFHCRCTVCIANVLHFFISSEPTQHVSNCTHTNTSVAIFASEHPDYTYYICLGELVVTNKPSANAYTRVYESPHSSACRQSNLLSQSSSNDKQFFSEGMLWTQKKWMDFVRFGREK